MHKLKLLAPTKSFFFLGTNLKVLVFILVAQIFGMDVCVEVREGELHSVGHWVSAAEDLLGHLYITNMQLNNK